MTKTPDLETAYSLRTPDDSRRLYRTWARTYDADFIEAHGFRMPRRIAEVYLSMGGGWPCLDVGCGTGAIGWHMPKDAVLDGLDISPEMLDVAAKTGRYRDLFEADLTKDLELQRSYWAGFVSSGTFTTGHVGPEALRRLCDHLAGGAAAAFTVKSSFYQEARFEDVLSRLDGEGSIADRDMIEEPIYTEGRAPDGHESDLGMIVTFRAT